MNGIIYDAAESAAESHMPTETETNSTPPPVVTQEIQLVDGDGKARLVLSVKSGSPVIEMLQPNGRASFAVSLDSAGRPTMKLSNPDEAGPTATLEIVDSGTHVKFVRPAGGTSYLFLNNAGGSGVVLIDTQGVRRLVALAPADGNVRIERFGPDGKPIP
jgi:hypothetical protein